MSDDTEVCGRCAGYGYIVDGSENDTWCLFCDGHGEVPAVRRCAGCKVPDDDGMCSDCLQAQTERDYRAGRR